MQKRMVIHHSPVIAYPLPKTRSDTLALPNIDPDAFHHIYVWMSQDKLDLLADCTRANISTGIQDACTLLCRMSAAASHLEIAGISLCSSNSSKQHLRWLAMKVCALLLPQAR